jgi:hypothetical protein
MAYQADDFIFPDELEEPEGQESDELEIEVEDDTPEEDKQARPPLPKDIVADLETADSAEDYSQNVKTKFKQYKKAWHDERRAKEEAYREQEEALAVAQRVIDENKRLKALLESGEKELIDTYKSSAELELDKARRNYKEAHEFGTVDAVIEAQQELIKATNKLDKAREFRPTAQNIELDAQLPQKQPKSVQPDPRVEQWVKENPWYIDPTKKSMSKFALGVHEELADTYGDDFIGSDEYYKHITQEVKRRFPEEFSRDNTDEVKPQRTEKLNTVVASAKRSTGPKKVVLTKTQVALARKFGITPEQYARELTKLEA